MRRLLDFVRGERVTDFSGAEGFEVFSDRVQPHTPGLGRRMCRQDYVQLLTDIAARLGPALGWQPPGRAA